MFTAIFATIPPQLMIQSGKNPITLFVDVIMLSFNQLVLRQPYFRLIAHIHLLVIEEKVGSNLSRAKRTA